MRIRRSRRSSVVVAWATIIGAVVLVPAVSAQEESLTVTPSVDLVHEQSVDVVATGIVDLGGVDTPLGNFLRPAVYQCDSAVAALDQSIVPAESVISFAQQFDGLCTPLEAPVPVVDGELAATVQVQQPFLNGATNVFGSSPILRDCTAIDCVVLVLAAHGSFDGLFGEIVIDYFEVQPIEFAPTIRPGAVVADPEGDAGTTVVDLPVELSEALGVAVTVDYAVVGDTAVAGDDFVAATGTIEFSPGVTAATVPIEIVGDTVGELIEVGQVEFSNPSPSAPNILGPGMFTIVDDDEGGTGFVAVDPADALVDGQSVDVSAVSVVDRGGVGTPIGFQWLPSVYQCAGDLTALGVAAVSGSGILDYLNAFDASCRPLAVDVDVVGGELAATVDVHQMLVTGGSTPISTVSNTFDCAADECVVLVMAASGFYDGFGGEVTIDYFATEPITFAPTIVPYGVLVSTEGDAGSSTWQVPVRLSRPVVDPVTVDYRTVDSPDPFVARSGQDHVATAGTLTFAPARPRRSCRLRCSVTPSTSHRCSTASGASSSSRIRRRTRCSTPVSSSAPASSSSSTTTELAHAGGQPRQSSSRIAANPRP